MPRRREGVQRGAHGALHHLVDDVGAGDGHRRVRAHPAGVGAGVAVADALEVLRRRERPSRVGSAVAHDEQRQLGTGEAFLDHERAPASPNASPER